MMTGPSMTVKWIEAKLLISSLRSQEERQSLRNVGRKGPVRCAENDECKGVRERERLVQEEETDARPEL